MADIKVSIRMPEELLEVIRMKELKPSEAIRDALADKYLGTKTDETEARLEEAVAKAKAGRMEVYDEFKIPVGDVICFNTSPQTQLWWCPDNKMAQVKELARVWEENGFKLCVGKTGRGTWYSPEVIEEEEQERKRNGRFSPSCHMISAYVGDRLVWLEVTRSDKALAFMVSHTEIPCAVRCDIHKYSSDMEYKEAFDKANELFIYYWANDRPKRVSSVAPTESDLCEIFDV